MKRDEAISLVRSEVKNENLIKHMLAVGAIMKHIAKKIGEDDELWEIAGILHDIDYEKTKSNIAQHSLISAEMLKGKIPEQAINAIKSHNFENTDVLPKSKMDFALIAADAISGLVIATALIYPSKKIEDVKTKSVTKRFKKKDFARNVSREHIMFCEKLGMNIEEFCELSVMALQEISDEIGL